MGHTIGQCEGMSACQIAKDMFSGQKMRLRGISAELAKPHRGKRDVWASGYCKIEKTTDQALVFGLQVSV